MKTKKVMDLVIAVVGSIAVETNIHRHDIIEYVFLKIEKTPKWLKIYNSLIAVLGKNVVNQWIGKYTFSLTMFPVSRKQTRVSSSKLVKETTHFTFM